MVDVTEQIQQVFELQKKQQHVAKGTSAAERIQKLQKLKTAIRTHTPAILQALQQDLEKPSFEAVTTEVLGVIQEIDRFIANLEQWMQPVEVDTQSVGHWQ
ncbi:aldehyde dehydrogenase family protein [Brevibacillus brevis]|uniref:aldehyde dehydrogenase family protein n=1 Tax=Brevibacillus brevis TaxID=1393 RepID=UPI00064E33CF|nr:aldehyde dehydrogenase family protein [Brevibacillus brevis]